MAMTFFFFFKLQRKVASSDLVNKGITVVSNTLKDIRDEEGYLKVDTDIWR